MKFVSCEKLIRRSTDAMTIGEWLDDNMPNPPLPDKQRWSLTTNENDEYGVEFNDEFDAIIFSLKWAS